MIVFENVRLIKFPEFDEADALIFEAALNRFFKKVGEDASLQLSLKQYKKGGLRAQHELHAKLTISNKVFFAERKEWLLLGVVQSVLKVLEREVKKAASL